MQFMHARTPAHASKNPARRLYSVLRLLPKGRETDFHDQYDITVIISSSMHNAPACKRLNETKADYIPARVFPAGVRRSLALTIHHLSSDDLGKETITNTLYKLPD
jgi:hypothetical protein